MKKILIIGAAVYQLPAIQRVVELGYEVYCVDYKEGQPGFEFATGYRVVDVKDKENCLKYAQELDVDGVMSWGSTLTLPTVSYIGERMNLPCMPISTAEISTSKYLIRKKLTDCGLNSGGEVFDLHSWEEADSKQYVVPFVVKPCDGSGSRGVYIVKDEAEIKKAIQYAFDGARDKQIYVEPYIEGVEYSAEAYASNGEVYVYSIVKTEFSWTKDYPVYKQTTYLGISKETEALIVEEVRKATLALGLNFGPINFDIIISDADGKPYIIDVGIRNGQNLIASHIVPYSRGVDELNNSINICIGNNMEIKPKRKEYISSRLLIYIPGTIEEIFSYQNLIGKDHIVDIIMRKKVGDVLPHYQTKSDICGWVLSKGETPEEASMYADKAWERLKKYIIIK